VNANGISLKVLHAELVRSRRHRRRPPQRDCGAGCGSKRAISLGQFEDDELVGIRDDVHAREIGNGLHEVIAVDRQLWHRRRPHRIDHDRMNMK